RIAQPADQEARKADPEGVAGQELAHALVDDAEAPADRPQGDQAEERGDAGDQVHGGCLALFAVLGKTPRRAKVDTAGPRRGGDGVVEGCGGRRTPSSAVDRTSRAMTEVEVEGRRAAAPLRESAYAGAFERAASRFEATLSMKPSVVSQPCLSPTSRARSLVMSPASTVSTQTFSRVLAKRSSSALPSSLARCSRPRVQAKI